MVAHEIAGLPSICQHVRALPFFYNAVKAEKGLLTKLKMQSWTKHMVVLALSPTYIVLGLDSLAKKCTTPIKIPFPLPPFSGPPRYELCIRPHSMANMHPFRALSFLLTGCSYPAIPVASHLGWLHKVSFLFGPQASPCIHFPHRVQSWLICTVRIT